MLTLQQGILHKILHPGEKHKEEETGRPKGLDYKDADEANHARHAHEMEAAGAGGALGVGGAGYETEKHHGVNIAHDASGHNKLHKDPPQGYAQDGRSIEPHTGLPVDLSKGTGQGGTDGAPQLSGIHQHGGASSGTGYDQGLDSGRQGGASTGTGYGNEGLGSSGRQGLGSDNLNQSSNANNTY